MLECLLYGVLGMSLIVAVLAAVSWMDCIKYDQWVREFHENGGIQWPIAADPCSAAHEMVLCTVLDGSDVVSHTVMVESRTNRV